MKHKRSVNTAAVLITVFLILVTAACLLYLLIPRSGDGCVAQIYQNGQLIRSIPLDQVTEPYTFEVENAEGGINRIEVRPGSIGVIWADCPNRLCVHQGFVDSPAIPVTCLPHKLVIRLIPAQGTRTDSAVPDATTY